ncbi:hypothetical protein [Phaffia rhodozyma]|uniref:Gylcosyl hydrolase 115 C-terminal domain-containing protein n=1 Tax=Phaffia rhodozyma TaxID=264483 RepID=A0A0F7SKT2_PHARH|nr:hypothetical protein [Phaffia rhodozyma]
MRLTIEESAWPGDNSNQCAIGYNCPPPMLPTLTQYGPKSRYFEVGQGSGVTKYTFVVAPNVTFVELSTTGNSVLASDESTWQQRIELTVPDWSQVPEGSSIVALSINSTTSDPSFLPAGIAQTYTIYATVVKEDVPSDFTGFVEADGGVSMEAAHMSRNSSINGTSWEIIPGYSSRSLSGGVTMFPVTSTNFTAGEGPRVEYDFYNFNNQSSGNVTVNLYMGMSFNFLPDRPIKYAIQIDDDPAQVVQPVPYGATDGADPPDWSDVPISSAGAHTLSIWGIEPALVLEKIVIDTGGVRDSYLGMPESQRV